MSLTVTPLNDAPVANNQSVTMDEDTSTAIVLTGSDVDHDSLTFTIVNGPTNGVISGFDSHTGALTYTPNTNFHGADTITFLVNDGTTNSIPATVSLTVTPLNDAPVANNQSVTLDEDTSTAIVLTGSDVDRDSLTFVIVNGPTNGVVSGFDPNTGALTYTPNTNFHGADTITFLVNDGTTNSVPATVSLTVRPLNNAPVANNQSVTLDEGTSAAIVLTGSDADGDPLTFVIVTGPTNGVITGFDPNTGALTYTPNTNFHETDSFTFLVNDGKTNSAPATVNITVKPAPTTGCDLFPIALHEKSLAGVPVGGVIRDIYNGVQPGNFGWLTWAGSPSEPTLATSLTPPGDSATYINPKDPSDRVVSVGDWVQGTPGVSNSHYVREALDDLEQIDITVPVWDQAVGTGNNSLYRVTAFARVRLISYQLPRINRITARFLGFADCP